MTPAQVQMVQSSWQQVTRIADQAADLFYDRLFELDPTLRPMFPEDLSEQKKKLMAMIGRVVATLHNLAPALPTIHELAVRHVGYGVQAQHYDTVGRALIWTLGKGLGDGWTTELENAWVQTYTTLATTMIEAASAAPSPVE